MPSEGFVTRISHDLYRKLVGEGAQGAETGIGSTGRVLAHDPGPARWHWLQQSMQRSIEQARTEARAHREIAHAQCFVLERVELVPEGDALRQNLERFVHEFDGEARIGWLRRIWPGSEQEGIVLDALQEVGLREPGQDAAAKDAYDAALHGTPAQDEGAALAIRFIGSWRARPAAQAREPAGAAEPAQATLLVRDAQGQRAVEMRRAELVLGSAGDVPVRGRYVSRRHVRLFVEGGRLWVSDAGSTNGAWIGESRLAPNERREIADHAELRLGAPAQEADRSEAECPRVIVTRVVARAGDGGATPILGGAPTPVIAASAAGTPLLTVTLVASGWRREVPIHRLPVTLGRSHNCELCVPEENEAVSGFHLRMVQLELPDGVWVEDLGSTRGSYLAGRRSSGRFLLPLGEPLTLGGTRVDERHSPVQLLARQPQRGEA